jgi:hypothetical protein
MTTMKRNLSLMFLAVASGGATECGQIVDDRGFDLWCGESLCTWTLEKGDIAPAPTWHPDDRGVDMIGDDVAIAQMTPVEFRDGTCVRFTLVADVAEDAEVRLQMDVFGDGTVETDERIPTSDWRKLTYLVQMPADYSGVKFRLTKRGTGHAVLANIGAEIAKSEECTTPAVEVSRPDGAYCTTDAECSNGACFEWLGDFKDVCGSCDADTDCSGGELCTVTGPAPGWLAVSSACLPPGTLADGLRCLRDANCASGMCIDGTCGACRAATDCGGAACLPAAAPVPARCDRGRGAGATCFSGADCDSGVCNGTALTGCDGKLDRECDTDADCPGELTDPELHSCATVGFAGGTCQ